MHSDRMTSEANVETGSAVGQPTSASDTHVREIDDRALVMRIVRAYQQAIARDPDSRASEWAAVEDDKKRPIHDVLMSGDIAAVTAILRDPGRTDLFYGFDNMCATFADAAAGNKGGLAKQAEELLVRVAEAIGVYPLPNKYFVAGEAHRSRASLEAPELEDTLKLLDASFGIRVAFANPFPGEFGAATSRGTASYRAIQALYQAWRISQLCHGLAEPRIVEIGAGLGRTAYFAWQLGLRDLTIIDIAMSGVAQAYFLGRVLGADAVWLYGEEPGPRACIRILPPSAFLDTSDHYDLLINIDSWTEMPKETARQYLRSALARCAMIWSVNHEAARFTVRELFAEATARPVARFPYWLRENYADEFVRTDVAGKKGQGVLPALPATSRLVGRARRRLARMKRGIVRFGPINKLITKLR
jgi:hypothetical protein